MKFRILLAAVAFAGLAASILAQGFPRSANITGRRFSDHDRCTVSVVVDGAAQVEIRGADATLTNVSGQPPQWRRFECTAPIPPNPAGFSFATRQGRGRQALIRPPRNGAPAVVRIDDPQPGAATYVFELSWRAGRSWGGFPTFR